MVDAHFTIRRARRTDFTAVMHLLAASGLPTPAPDRATLRRFRNVVADLGGDFYVALVDGTLAGLVHVTYARRLTVLPSACLELVVVVEAARRHGIGSALLGFVRDRARRRGCASFACELPTGDAAVRSFLEKNGLHHQGEWFAEDLRASTNA